MADNDKSFPNIGESNWWKLRNLFRQKVPSAVTPTYLANALSMTNESASANIIGPFKKIGFLDETGKPLDLAYDWRDDSKYPKVCQALLEQIYPQEVRDLYHSGDIDTKQLSAWFMNYCRIGEQAARKYAAFYKLLLTADPSGASESTPRKPKISDSKPKAPKVQNAKNNVKAIEPKIDSTPPSVDPVQIKEEKPHSRGSSLPQLHINIQLHISPESTPEQIDSDVSCQ